MYKLNFTLKVFCLSLFLAFSSALSAQFCIGISDITRDNGIVDGVNTVFSVNVTFTGLTTANSVDLSVIGPGTLSDCSTANCEDIPINAGSSISFKISINTAAGSSRLVFDGFDSGLPNPDQPCGQEVILFPGEAALPAELLSFDGTAMERANKLIWQTASEENVAAFQVERAIDGRSFSAVGNVPASGNSEDLRNYAFTDEAPLSLSYYRLKIVDFDGSFEYSDVLTIERTKSEITQVEVFPVPVVDSEITILVHSKSDGVVLLDLFDMTGKILEQSRLQVTQGINSMTINLPKDNAQLYYLTVYNGDERISKTILRSSLD